jgi:hypothetical protein
VAVCWWSGSRVLLKSYSGLAWTCHGDAATRLLFEPVHTLALGALALASVLLLALGVCGGPPLGAWRVAR